MAKYEGIVMDGSMKGQRLAHFQGRYVVEHMESCPGLGRRGRPEQILPMPHRWQETYVFYDGSDKKTVPGWYLQ